MLGPGKQAAAAQRTEAACARLLALLATPKGRASPAGSCARSAMLALGAAAAIAGLAAVQTEAGRLAMGDLAASPLVVRANGMLASAWERLQPAMRGLAQEVGLRRVLFKCPANKVSAGLSKLMGQSEKCLVCLSM